MAGAFSHLGQHERGLASCDAALTVFTQHGAPYLWASIKTTLAKIYSSREQGERADNLEKAVAACQAALTFFTPEALPIEYLKAALALTDILIEQRGWIEAYSYLQRARTAFLLLFGDGLEESNNRYLIEIGGSLFNNLAYAAAEMGDVQASLNYAAEGRARLLAVALKMQAQHFSSEQQSRIEVLRREIRERQRLQENAEGTERTSELERLSALRRELLTVINGASAKDSSEGVMQVARDLLVNGGVIIVPIVTAVGTKMLIGTAKREDGLLNSKQAASEPSSKCNPDFKILEVPGLTADVLDKLAKEWRGGFSLQYVSSHASLSQASDADTRERLFNMWLDAVAGVGQKLWRTVVEPFVREFESLSVERGAQIILLPTDALGVLPLGLAENPTNGMRLAEAYQLIYAPSFDALRRGVISIAKSEQRRLAAIANPTGDLPFTQIEVRLVTCHFDPMAQIVLEKTRATKSAVLDALRGKKYWHIACHGQFDWNDARNSSLLLSKNERITVAELLTSSGLGWPRLVVLSACETGLYDARRSPNEFVGLPVAFIALGATGVLATLWQVDDRATALLMARFYDFHMDLDLPPAAALSRAQSWLREATKTDLIAYVEAITLKEGIEDMSAIQTLKNSLMRGGYEDSDLLPFQEQPRVETDVNIDDTRYKLFNLFSRKVKNDERPFAHPYYWGGFVYTGL